MGEMVELSKIKNDTVLDFYLYALGFREAVGGPNVGVKMGQSYDSPENRYNKHRMDYLRAGYIVDPQFNIWQFVGHDAGVCRKLEVAIFAQAAAAADGKPPIIGVEAYPITSRQAIGIIISVAAVSGFKPSDNLWFQS
jgi:hypothetical protein